MPNSSLLCRTSSVNSGPSHYRHLNWPLTARSHLSTETANELQMPRHLLEQSVDRLAEIAAPPLAVAKATGGVHTDTLLILAAVLCFLLCVVGLALVARCSRLCNPSAFSVDASPTLPKAPCKGIKKKALQSLPTVSWAARPEQRENDGEVPECAICLADFARGDEVRILPSCGHGFHAACVDVWLLSSSTCPSCRRALVVSPPATEAPAACSGADVAPQASSAGRCRSSAP